MPNYLPYPNQPERETKPAAGAPVSVAYLEPLESKGAPEGEPRGVLEYLQLLRGHRTLLVAMLALGTGAGCLVSWLQTPVYEARSYLEFQSQGHGEAGVLGDKDVGGGFGPENFLQTQVRVLESRSLRKRVEDKFASEPVAEAPPGRLRRLRKFFGLAGPAAPTGHRRGVEVTANIVANSRIVEIVCESSDARYSAAFANALAHEYIEYSLESIWESSSRTSRWMNKQLEHLKTNLEESENRLQEYGRENGLVYTGAEQSVEEDTLKQLQAEYSSAKADRIAKQSLSEIAASSQG
ncbi:MAG TPA: Wzz/FepE/Etk N-terminal domain-containing protein, partial [Bryobacteraceae bacterium]